VRYHCATPAPKTLVVLGVGFEPTKGRSPPGLQPGAINLSTTPARYYLSASLTVRPAVVKSAPAEQFLSNSIGSQRLSCNANSLLQFALAHRAKLSFESKPSTLIHAPTTVKAHPACVGTL
jgi:hypothetical protein